MASAPDLDGVGLGELVHRLVGETFEAVHSSHLDQARQKAELLALAELSTEEYADREVAEETVDQLLGQHFPDSDGEGPHGIAVGATYRPATETQPEKPPIRKVTGIRLEVGDYAAVDSEPACHALMAPAVDAVRSWARHTLAARELAPLRELARTGIPVVAVQKGRLKVKATYSLGEQSDRTADDPAITEEPGHEAPRQSQTRQEVPDTRRSREAMARPQGMLAGRIRSSTAAQTGAARAAEPRLLVRPVDERRADVKNLSADVFGDVELEFYLRD